MSRLALLDMDNTLADYNGEMARRLALLTHPNEPAWTAGFYDIYNDATPWLRERTSLIKNSPRFWRDLPVLKRGFDVVTVLRELDFSMQILSKAPKSSVSAWEGKALWCQDRFRDGTLPEMPINLVQDKSIAYGKVLVDDWPMYMLAWLEHRPRGLGIMPAQPWNADFTHRQVVRYDGTNLDEIRDRLSQIV